MLTIFVRHTRKCLPGLLDKKLSPEKLRQWRHCQCPKWFSGTHDGRTYPRETLNANSWAEAERKLDIVKNGDQQAAISVKDAVAAWLEEVQLNGVADSTLASWKMIGNRLLAYCERSRIRSIVDLDAAAVNRWRKEWQQEDTHRRQELGVSPATAYLRITILKLFFKFVRRMRWTKENPMDLVRVAKKSRQEDGERIVATLPLDQEGDSNYQKLLQAIPKHLSTPVHRALMTRHPGHLVAITELMYETGLRVSDAIMFEPDRMEVDSDGWGTYTTKQIKTQTAVTTSIPPALAEKLLSLPRLSPRYLFYDGVTNLKQYYRYQIYQQLKAVGDAIGIEGVRPHRLRDSFAVNRLNEGFSMHDVSRLLGHASVAMTERYYAPFVKSRKDALVAARKALHGGSKVVPIRKRAG